MAFYPFWSPTKLSVIILPSFLLFGCQIKKNFHITTNYFTSKMSALLFLCKKNFHPGRNQNKKKVWLAEQEAAQREQKERERNKLVNEENQRNILKYGSAATASLDFMYAPPPGYVGEKERLQLEQRKKEKEERDAQQQQQQQQQRQQLSRREREKKEAEERPEDRFSFLKNAPVHGNASRVPMTMVTSFKPLGIEIRNVRCLRCKQWGHSKGDKVCTMQQLKIEKGAVSFLLHPFSSLILISSLSLPSIRRTSTSERGSTSRDGDRVLSNWRHRTLSSCKHTW
jgi:hypothetical protein